MMKSITANDLKIKGITLLDQLVSSEQGAFITVGGREQYVILSIEAYNYLRECELDAALAESEKDNQAVKSHCGTIEDHLKRLKI